MFFREEKKAKAEGVKMPPENPARLSLHLKSKVSLALAKAATLRINLNIDGEPKIPHL